MLAAGFRRKDEERAEGGDRDGAHRGRRGPRQGIVVRFAREPSALVDRPRAGEPNRCSAQKQEEPRISGHERGGGDWGSMGHHTAPIARSLAGLGVPYVEGGVMPVLGHAFVGLAIGISTRPSAQRPSETVGMGAASISWLPAVVTLAYLPDIVAQLGLLAGWSDSRLLGHSVIFAVAVSPAIAAVLRRLARVSFARAFVTALLSPGPRRPRPGAGH